MFKTVVRTFCDHKVAFGRTINRATVLDVLKQQKRNSKLTYAEIAKKLDKNEIHTASVFNGEHPFDETDFETIYRLLLSGCFAGRGDKALVKNALMEIPVRGQNCLITKDPTVYRLNELVNVYGLSIKELIEEKAGNGIMSAIDCKIDVRVLGDAGEERRVEIKIDGKFLRYHL